MVFEDPSQGRWKRVRLGALAVALLGALLIAAVVYSAIARPALATLPAGGDEGDSVTIEQVTDNLPAPGAAIAASRWSGPLMGRGFLRTAFVEDDPGSIADLKRNIGRLDAVFPDYYTIGDYKGGINAAIEPELARVLSGARVKVLPTLSNVNSRGDWDGEVLTEVFRDEDVGGALVRGILAHLQADHADGINIDFEEVEPADKDVYLDWLQTLAIALHRKNLLLTVDVPVDAEEAFDYELIGQYADAVVVMGYDEHYSGGPPGSVAAQDWFDDAVEDLSQRVPPQKLIIALGAYGYDWNAASPAKAVAVGFDQAMDLARSHVAKIQTDPQAINSTFAYRDTGGARHEVWLLDAVSAWNEFQTARRFKCGGVSLWRLGFEEQALWDFFGLDAPALYDPANLKTVRPPASVVFHGRGEMVEVRHLAGDGARTLSIDAGRIDHASYDRLPQLFEVHKRGHAGRKKIALSFDDGPDPTWTPQVLGVLRDNRVPAAFFLVGRQVQQYPALARAEVAAGHLIGSHTFLHPNLATLPDARLKAELNLTQRLIEGSTGHQALLFRTPYDTDSAPALVDQLRPLNTAARLGYVCVGADIDSADYQKPGADRIVQNVLDGLNTTGSNIIVMHDAGGDRAQTVQALGRLIPVLKARGYEFVALNDLLGVPRESLMPVAPAFERVISSADSLVAWLWRSGWWLLVRVFFVTTAFSVLRIILLGALVLRHRQRRGLTASTFAPPALVLIPAYNEAKVIARTLESVLQSTYRNFRVLVVDDGSTDGTAAIAREVSRNDPRVCVTSKPNGGKCSALNRGFRQAWEKYIVTIDADTLILPETLGHLIGPLADSSIDAVCGNVQVGRVKRLLTRLQDVEYVTCQNYDRRAFEALNCISVVPGATGAWRRDSVLRAGGYSADTLTEDADLTLTLLRQGAKIIYAPHARSITEAPRDARSLFKQRFRWCYGTLQCLWKHRDRFGHGSLGLAALPNLLLFQLIFPVLSPLGDLVLLISLLRGDFGAVLAGYLIFLAIDLVGSTIAFLLDERRLGNIWVVLVQRFYYRQFMYVVTLRCLLAALRGARHGWNKLERHGSVARERSARYARQWPPGQPTPAHTAA